MITDVNLARLRERTAPFRATLLSHPVYRHLDTAPALRVFVQHHVFAVWDFMSLLKLLQRRLCCVAVPWLPPQFPALARIMNEIVLAEESDCDRLGGFGSHFELYRQAMASFGADTGVIDRFLELLAQGRAVREGLTEASVPSAAGTFVRHTFGLIESDDICAVASAFAFGREELLPEVFQRITNELDQADTFSLDDFRYYLNRHIELDGDHHASAATSLVVGVCGGDPAKWRRAEDAAVGSLVARKELWDGVLALLLPSEVREMP